MPRPAYPSDLNDAEWDSLKEHLPPPSKIGSPRSVDLREIVNAIFYWADNGIKWRAMPHDFPPWSTVYAYFRRWVRNGLWAQLNATFVTRVRLAAGRQAQPSLAIIDSQSVEMAQKGGLNKVSMATSTSKVASAT
jgi:transposase